MVQNQIFCLRSAEGNGWGRAWGAAAVGGILLSILALLMLLAISPQFEHARQVKSLGDAAAIAAKYRLPVPADSELQVQTNDISRSLLKQRLKNPQPNRSYGDWTEVWPCNEQLSLYSNEEPPQLAKFLAGSLTKAGYRVQQGETIIYGSSQAGRKYGSKAGQWVAGAKPGLFVVYQCNYVGSVGRFTGTYGVVRIWRDFAKEMEAECAAAAAQGKSK